MNEGREFGIALLLFTDGVSTLIVDVLVGYLFQLWANYNPIFNMMGALSMLGSVLIFVSELIHNRHYTNIIQYEEL